MLKNTWLLILVGVVLILLGIIAGSYNAELSEFVHSHALAELLGRFAPYAGWLSAFCALVALVWNVDQAQYKMGIELTLKIGERFEPQTMLTHRLQAAKSLLADSVEPNHSVDAVLDFFEEICFLLEKNAIADDEAWTFLFYWLDGYYFSTKDYRIQANEEENGTAIFEGIENVHKKLMKIENVNVPPYRNPYKQMSAEEINEFLESESILLGKPERFRVRARRSSRALQS